MSLNNLIQQNRECVTVILKSSHAEEIISVDVLSFWTQQCLTEIRITLILKIKFLKLPLS